MAAGGAKMRGEARSLPLCTLFVTAVAVSLGLQGCGGDAPVEEPKPSLVLKPSQLTTNASRKASINYNRVIRDCSGTYLATRLNRSSDEFRKEASDQLKELKDIPEKTRQQHIDAVFPKDAAKFFIDDRDTGFLRKDEVYCHIRRHLNDMAGKAQLDSMVEEVQSRVSHIMQFLPENGYGFLDAQNNNESIKAMKRYYKLSDLSTELFIKLRQVMIPLKEEQMKTALYAVSAFATGGCLKDYYEDHLKAWKCPWQMDNTPLYDEEEEAAKKAKADEEKKGKKNGKSGEEDGKTTKAKNKSGVEEDSGKKGGKGKEASSALEQSQETVAVAPSAAETLASQEPASVAPGAAESVAPAGEGALEQIQETAAAAAGAAAESVAPTDEGAAAVVGGGVAKKYPGMAPLDESHREQQE